MLSSSATVPDGRWLCLKVVDNIIQVTASAYPGKHKSNASKTNRQNKYLLCQPSCCSKSASFRRPLPTSTAAAPIARTLTKVQSASNSSCITSTPCTSCTATPTTLQDDRKAWPAKGDEDTIATSRTDEPSRISTCRPV